MDRVLLFGVGACAVAIFGSASHAQQNKSVWTGVYTEQQATEGAAVYSASKYAVEGLTRAAALEAAPANVRVNAVAPGPVRTGMMDRFFGTEDNVKTFVASHIPLNRVGTPEEIAETILFLASDKVPFITGQTFGVDGGAS